jgi:hypothetical protein
MGKGSLVPKRAPVEVRIGRAITAEELRALAETEGAGAYRKIADLMRTAVIVLSGTRSKLMRGIEIETLASNGAQSTKRARAKVSRSPELPRGHAKA